MDVNLYIFRADGSSKTIPIKPGRYVIGRHDDATLRIPLPTVSRKHCELVHDGSSLRVRDLGSSNGTYRNEERIEETELEAGDVLGVGEFRMSVQIDGEPAEVKPPPQAPTPPPEQAPAEQEAATTPMSDDEEEEVDLEKTVTKPGMGNLLAGSNTEESSIFDFDFDFEDDENPQL